MTGCDGSIPGVAIPSYHLDRARTQSLKLDCKDAAANVSYVLPSEVASDTLTFMQEATVTMRLRDNVASWLGYLDFLSVYSTAETVVGASPAGESKSSASKWFTGASADRHRLAVTVVPKHSSDVVGMLMPPSCGQSLRSVMPLFVRGLLLDCCEFSRRLLGVAGRWRFGGEQATM